jgi:hypothetical protein
MKNCYNIIVETEFKKLCVFIMTYLAMYFSYKEEVTELLQILQVFGAKYIEHQKH